MTRFSLVLRSLRFYWRTHLGVVAGAAVSSAVLVGALFVGDSVRASLERLALARLGRVHHALDSGERSFRSDLAGRLKLDAAVALRVRGMAIREKTQVNRVEVLGIGDGFMKFGEPSVALKPEDVLVNEKLAAALGVRVGDEISLRMFKPGLLSRDAPLARQEDRETQRDRFTVRAVLSDAQLGRFSLRSDQAGPHNAFLRLDTLQEKVGLEGFANLIVTGEGDVQAALRKAWTLEDAGLALRPAEGVLQLESPRIYLDPAVAKEALRPGAVGSLAYLVNSLSAESGKSTPYSFMAALSPSADPKLGIVPADMKDDEILVNRWVADHLAVKAGDAVKVAYYEVSPSNEYVERSRSFKVRAVVEKAALASERELVPKFPGLTDVDRCRDWKIGIPLDEEKLKDKANEAYWEEYKQTPKAFVTLAAGREMWANRWGDLMSVRYPATVTPDEVRATLGEKVDPSATGLLFRPAREQALRAARESMDLGQLFLGMSLFLIAASLVLTAMLFTFTVEQRARETGVLLATGHTPGGVRRLLILEGGIVAAAGAVLGIPFGWAFAQALLRGLASFWSGAVADASIGFHASAASALVGAGAAAALSVVAVSIALWRQARRPVRELVADDFTLSLEKRSGGKGRLRWAVLVASILGAAGIVAGAFASGMQNPAPAFFGAGALALAGGVALIRILLDRTGGGGFTVGSLGARNASRRPGRAMATAGMLACGSFVVFAVSAMKEDLELQGSDRSSGTGGFELYAESSVPVRPDLNSEKGRDRFLLKDMEGVSFVQLKARDGDDASCLNLNMALSPPLVGVDADKLAALGAFVPAEVWKRLDEGSPDGAIPALVGDSATALWKLKKKVGPDGDLLDYLDERGNAVKVRLIGAFPVRLSVFQGKLLVSNRHFTRLYPSESGTRLFLVDVAPGREAAVAAHLSRRMDEVGLDVVRSVDRLKEFYVVETTYLMMFLVLGGLGLVLGSAGMAVLVLRNVLERRSELALLRAVGYTTAQVGKVVMAEHRFLLAAGLAVGTAAALLAVVPAAAQPGVSVPFGLLALFLVGTAALSLAWIWLAARLALRSPLIAALRNE